MEKSGKFRLTSLERNWILYDVGNSAFVLMVATLIPIFFNALAEAGGLSSVEYLAYWGYASSAVTVITAVLSPILGTVADTKGFKKPIFILCVFVGIVGCCAMGAASAWLPFLVIFVIAKVGFSGSLVFYDSMLSDVTTPERMDEVSSRGYAWGYIGSCVPFVVCLGLVLGAGSIGISQMTALNLALLLTAAWWLLTTLPLLKSYKQLHYVEVEKHAVRQSFARIGHTLRSDEGDEAPVAHQIDRLHKEEVVYRPCALPAHRITRRGERRVEQRNVPEGDIACNQVEVPLVGGFYGFEALHPHRIVGMQVAQD